MNMVTRYTCFFRKIFALLLCIVSFSSVTKAQVPATAATYPFVASSKPFNYLVGGTAVNLAADDITVSAIPIGFSFPFCTGTYTTVSACSNGWIWLGNTSVTTFSNTSATSLGGPSIMAFFEDMTGSGSGPSTYLTTGTAPNRVFTFEWKDWRPLASTTNSEITFQIKLYEGGVIECLYKQELGTYASYTTTIGIANSGTDYQTLPVSSASPTPTLSPGTFNVSISTRPATGQSYLWGKIPCTGTPNTSVMVPQPICKGKPFTLDLSNISLLSGLTFQWQESPDGISWTNIAGATNSTYTDVIYAPKWYRCIVTCTNSSVTTTTTGVKVEPAPFYYCYCNTTATAAPGADVGNVTVNALPSNAVLLNNGIATPLENNPASNKGYSYFSQTLPPIPMYRDSLYKITVSQTNSATFVAARTAVYIDANRNGTFDDSERVINQPSLNVLPNPGVVTLPSYKLPTWAVGYGLTGMRVIIKAGTTDPDTCGAYTNGETEDYVVDMRMIPCNGKPNPGVILGDTSMCNGYKYVLTDTTVQKDRHGIDHYWQLSADGVNWNDIPGSLNKDTLTRIFNIQPLYYRVVATCSHTNDTAYTPAHKVNIKPGYKCYCFSQSTGTNEDTSDIGSFKIAKFEVTDKGTHLLNPKALRERTDYTDLPPIEIDVDSVYNFYVFHTMPYNNHADGKITVFVDFDNDKQYDIPEERIYTGFTSIGNHVKLGTLMIPNNVIVNMPTGLRIVINNDVAPNPASDEGCGTYQSGETEDFIVLFSRPFGVSVKEAEGVNQLSLVPNPTNGVFQVQFKGAAAEQVTVKVTTVTGQVVKQEVYPHSGGIFRQAVDMGNQPKGVYMVEVSANGQKMMQKLVLQ